MATSAKAAPAMHTTSKPSIAALAPVPAVAVTQTAKQQQ